MHYFKLIAIPTSACACKTTTSPTRMKNKPTIALVRERASPITELPPILIPQTTAARIKITVRNLVMVLRI